MSLRGTDNCRLTTARGEQYRTWGDKTYPIESEYDIYGRQTRIKTFRGGSGWNGNSWPSDELREEPDVTVFYYGAQESDRRVWEKEYADGTFVQYRYTPDGKVATRKWARTTGGDPYSYIRADYTYDPKTGDLTGIDYSDNTPDLTYRYYRSGQLHEVDDVVGTRTFVYNTTDLQLNSETIVGAGDYYSTAIIRSYEGISDAVPGRPNGFSIGAYGDVQYHYDSVGRLERITGPGLPVYGAEYSWSPGSEMTEYLRYKSAPATTLASMQQGYEANRDVVAFVENRTTEAPSDPVSRYGYTNDSLGRREGMDVSGTAYIQNETNVWGYNSRNELISSKRYTGTYDNLGAENTPYRRLYEYDNIGNRELRTQGAETLYYCMREDESNHSTNQYAHTSAGLGCPTPSESFYYDDDGNLVGADQTYMGLLWDAENQLIMVEPISPAVDSKKVKFAYDYLGRRVRKQVFLWDSSTEMWEEESESDEMYVYDGFHVVLVLDAKNENSVLRKYTWGLDLSGHCGDASPGGIHGAGGIGGLLATVETGGTLEGTYWYLYDANGNVGQVLDAADGSSITLSAKYEYDPYGNETSTPAAGSFGAHNPFRFSTKWLDAETGLYYYGYRYYSPSLGRWISRDPIEERGGTNLYALVNNNPINSVDPFGLFRNDIHYSLTKELAEMAGIACPEKIAAGANRPDVDDRRSGAIGVWDIFWNGFVSGSTSVSKEKIKLMADWHFPADPDGVVRPNSIAARGKALTGLKGCSLDDFAEGLHVLQDSWSHQGKPYIAGIGHWRGVVGRSDTDRVRHHLGPVSPYVSINGSLYAARTDSTDQAHLFPADVRNAAMATFELLKDFRDKCRCACYEEHGTRGYWYYQDKRVTWAETPPKSDEDVLAWLLYVKGYKGENVSPGWVD